MFKLRFLFPIVALIAISDALPHTDEQLTQELEQAKQEQIKLARRIAKLERQAVALDAEQTSRETSGRNIKIIVGVIAVIKGKRWFRFPPAEQCWALGNWRKIMNIDGFLTIMFTKFTIIIIALALLSGCGDEGALQSVLPSNQRTDLALKIDAELSTFVPLSTGNAYNVPLIADVKTSLLAEEC